MNHSSAPATEPGAPSDPARGLAAAGGAAADGHEAASTATAESPVQVRATADGCLSLTLNRPARHNALSLATLDALRAAITDGVGPDTRCVLLTGAGRRCFAAGGDLIELDGVRSEAAVDAMLQRAGAALDAVRSCPVPTVAFLNGDALGGGAELAVACDMRVFAAHARIGFIQARLAITPAWGGGVDLHALVGPARATRLIARAELVDAPQALAWGLADAVLEAGDGEAAALEAFLQPLAERPPHVARAIKATAAAARRGASHEEQRRLEAAHFRAAWLHPAHWDAVAAVFPRARG